MGFGNFNDVFAHLGKGQTAKKHFTAEANGQVEITFDLLELDTWDNENILIKVAGKWIDLGRFRSKHNEGNRDGSVDGIGWSITTDGQQQNLSSGHRRKDQAHEVKISFDASILDGQYNTFIEFKSTLNENKNNESFAINDLQIKTTSAPAGLNDNNETEQISSGKEIIVDVLENTSSPNGSARIQNVWIDGQNPGQVGNAAKYSNSQIIFVSDNNFQGTAVVYYTVTDGNSTVTSNITFEVSENEIGDGQPPVFPDDASNIEIETKYYGKDDAANFVLDASDIGDATLQLKFEFIEVDSWDNEQLVLRVAGKTIDLGTFNHKVIESDKSGSDSGVKWWRDSASSKTDEYGSGWSDQTHTYQITIDKSVHNHSEELEIEIDGRLSGNKSDESFLIKNLKATAPTPTAPPVLTDENENTLTIAGEELIVDVLANANTSSDRTLRLIDAWVETGPDGRVGNVTLVDNSKISFQSGQSEHGTAIIQYTLTDGVEFTQSSLTIEVSLPQFTFPSMPEDSLVLDIEPEKYGYNNAAETIIDTSSLQSNPLLLEFTFVEVDSWDRENFAIQIGNQTVNLGNFHHGTLEEDTSGTADGVSWWRDSASSFVQVAGSNAWYDQIHKFHVKIDASEHQNNPNLNVKFVGYLNSDTSDEAFYISELRSTAPSFVDIVTIEDSDEQADVIMGKTTTVNVTEDSVSSDGRPVWISNAWIEGQQVGSNASVEFYENGDIVFNSDPVDPTQQIIRYEITNGSETKISTVFLTPIKPIPPTPLYSVEIDNRAYGRNENAELTLDTTEIGQQPLFLNFTFQEIDSWDNEEFMIGVGDVKISLGGFRVYQDEGDSSGYDSGIAWWRQSGPMKHLGGGAWTDQSHVFQLMVSPDVHENSADLGIRFYSRLDEAISNESFRIHNVYSTADWSGDNSSLVDDDEYIVLKTGDEVTIDVTENASARGRNIVITEAAESTDNDIIAEIDVVNDRNLKIKSDFDGTGFTTIEYSLTDGLTSVSSKIHAEFRKLEIIDETVSGDLTTDSIIYIQNITPNDNYSGDKKLFFSEVSSSDADVSIILSGEAIEIKNANPTQFITINYTISDGDISSQSSVRVNHDPARSGELLTLSQSLNDILPPSFTQGDFDTMKGTLQNGLRSVDLAVADITRILRKDGSGDYINTLSENDIRNLGQAYESALNGWSSSDGFAARGASMIWAAVDSKYSVDSNFSQLITLLTVLEYAGFAADVLPGYTMGGLKIANKNTGNFLDVKHYDAKNLGPVSLNKVDPNLTPTKIDADDFYFGDDVKISFSQNGDEIEITKVPAGTKLSDIPPRARGEILDRLNASEGLEYILTKGSQFYFTTANMATNWTTEAEDTLDFSTTAGAIIQVKLFFDDLIAHYDALNTGNNWTLEDRADTANQKILEFMSSTSVAVRLVELIESLDGEKSIKEELSDLVEDLNNNESLDITATFEQRDEADIIDGTVLNTWGSYLIIDGLIGTSEPLSLRLESSTINGPQQLTDFKIESSVISPDTTDLFTQYGEYSLDPNLGDDTSLTLKNVYVQPIIDGGVPRYLFEQKAEIVIDFDDHNTRNYFHTSIVVDSNNVSDIDITISDGTTDIKYKLVTNYTGMFAHGNNAKLITEAGHVDLVNARIKLDTLDLGYTSGLQVRSTLSFEIDPNIFNDNILLTVDVRANEPIFWLEDVYLDPNSVLYSDFKILAEQKAYDLEILKLVQRDSLTDVMNEVAVKADNAADDIRELSWYLSGRDFSQLDSNDTLIAQLYRTFQHWADDDGFDQWQRELYRNAENDFNTETRDIVGDIMFQIMMNIAGNYSGQSFITRSFWADAASYLAGKTKQILEGEELARREGLIEASTVDMRSFTSIETIVNDIANEYNFGGSQFNALEFADQYNDGFDALQEFLANVMVVNLWSGAVESNYLDLDALKRFEGIDFIDVYTKEATDFHWEFSPWISTYSTLDHYIFVAGSAEDKLEALKYGYGKNGELVLENLPDGSSGSLVHFQTTSQGYVDNVNFSNAVGKNIDKIEFQNGVYDGLITTNILSALNDDLRSFILSDNWNVAEFNNKTVIDSNIVGSNIGEVLGSLNDRVTKMNTSLDQISANFTDAQFADVYLNDDDVYHEISEYLDNLRFVFDQWSDGHLSSVLDDVLSKWTIANDSDPSDFKPFSLFNQVMRWNGGHTNITGNTSKDLMELKFVTYWFKNFAVNNRVSENSEDIFNNYRDGDKPSADSLKGGMIDVYSKVMKFATKSEFFHDQERRIEADRNIDSIQEHAEDAMGNLVMLLDNLRIIDAIRLDDSVSNGTKILGHEGNDGHWRITRDDWIDLENRFKNIGFGADIGSKDDNDNDLQNYYIFINDEHHPNQEMKSNLMNVSSEERGILVSIHKDSGYATSVDWDWGNKDLFVDRYRDADFITWDS